MSHYRSNNKFDPIQPPPRWLNCPRKANQLIVDKFIAFKVPLSQKFNPNVPLENRFHMQMLIDSVKKNFNAKIGLIIDLTNTDRFYDADNEVKKLGIKYFKLKCKGHGETPSEENKNFFVSLVEKFCRTNPTEIIGVHCTHGFNRTGFLICSYLVEKLDYSLDMAVAMFTQARPPGIYKQDYLDKLYNMYVKDEESREMIQRLVAPELPTWEEEVEASTSSAASANLDDDGEDLDDDFEEETNGEQQNGATKEKRTDTPTMNKRNAKRKRLDEAANLNAKFADPDLEGVETCTDPDEISRVRRETQEICGWRGAGFPGAQPVSMDQQNVRLLWEKRYMVSWKADGTRYLMYINGPNKTYLFDRDNSVFIARNLTFLHRKTGQPLLSTLLDGEFVIDLDPENKNKIPRFLIYDIIKFEKDEVGKQNFEIRMICIDKEIIFARNEAMKVGRINRQIEPFSIRKKQFCPIIDTKKFLSDEFTKNISHGIDGLIYQPVDDAYKPGRCDTMLKWKPPSMNSVDFKLQITVKEEMGMLPEKTGYLYVMGYDPPFSTIKVTKSIMNLNEKIIECRWHNNSWDFMRERVDKSYPNHYTTAMAVCESIKNPITQEKLLEFIENIEKRRSMMPPPPPPPPPANHKPQMI